MGVDAVLEDDSSKRKVKEWQLNLKEDDDGKDEKTSHQEDDEKGTSSCEYTISWRLLFGSNLQVATTKMTRKRVKYYISLFSNERKKEELNSSSSQHLHNLSDLLL